ncbi:hypothetical protein [Burkholderia sp. 3C]
MNQALGNIVTNALATGAGAAVGGESGAFSGYNVDRFNRQLHPDEKTLAKQLAAESNGKYTHEQIEDQLRIMGGLIGADRESGAPATLVGTMPIDLGAQWQYAGTTDDGKPILTQITVRPNSELQSCILTNSASAQNDVPDIMYDSNEKKDFGFKVTGPFTKFDQSDTNFMRNTTADAASMVSTNAVRVSAAAGAAAALPGPHSVEAAGLSFSAAVVSLVASSVQQLLNPQPWSFGLDSLVDLVTFYGSDRYPLIGPFFTEMGETAKNSGWAGHLKNSSQEK